MLNYFCLEKRFRKVKKKYKNIKINGFNCFEILYTFKNTTDF